MRASCSAGVAIAAVLLSAVGASAPAHADDDQSIYPTAALVPDAPKGDIVIDTPGDRTTLNIVAISVAAGVGALVAAGGVYFNLQARSDANDLSAGGNRTLATWDASHQSKQSDIHTDNISAGVMYGVGGALLVGAVIALIVTAPRETRTVIHPHTGPTPVLAPTPGGAVLGGSWSF